MTIENILAGYAVISAATCFVLLIRWAECDGGGEPIWPIAGILWPILALIGVWKAWEHRND